MKILYESDGDTRYEYSGHGRKDHICLRCRRAYDRIKNGRIDKWDTTINSPGYACDLWGEVKTKSEDNGDGYWVLECDHFQEIPQATIYADYMESDAWKSVRERRMKHDGYKCVMCGSAINLCVHHLTYENLGDEPMEDLITLCAKCHKALHAADLAKK